MQSRNNDKNKNKSKNENNEYNITEKKLIEQR